MLWPSQAKVDAELSNQAKKTFLLQLRFILRSVSATFVPVFIVKKQSCSLDRIPNLLLMGTESIDVSFVRLYVRLGSNHVMIISISPGELYLNSDVLSIHAFFTLVIYIYVLVLLSVT